MWRVAEYRGRGRQATWGGRACFGGAVVSGISKINIWNHERRLERTGSDTVKWDALTTGNFGGFDAHRATEGDGEFDLACNHGHLHCRMADIGIDDTVMEAGGPDRQSRVFRLPDHNPHRNVSHRLTLLLRARGDNPIWVCVTTEDGNCHHRPSVDLRATSASTLSTISEAAPTYVSGTDSVATSSSVITSRIAGIRERASASGRPSATAR